MLTNERCCHKHKNKDNENSRTFHAAKLPFSCTQFVESREFLSLIQTSTTLTLAMILPWTEGRRFMSFCQSGIDAVKMHHSLNKMALASSTYHKYCHCWRHSQSIIVLKQEGDEKMMRWNHYRLPMKLWETGGCLSYTTWTKWRKIEVRILLLSSRCLLSHSSIIANMHIEPVILPVFSYIFSCFNKIKIK